MRWLLTRLVLNRKSCSILLLGAGAFFTAARRANHNLKLHGSELHATALAEARQNGLNQDDLADVVLGDFLDHKFRRRFPAIVANPPYIRHHRLSLELKGRLRHYAIQRLGFALDGRAGLHIYFLLRALEVLGFRRQACFYRSGGYLRGDFRPAALELDNCSLSAGSRRDIRGRSNAVSERGHKSADPLFEQQFSIPEIQLGACSETCTESFYRMVWKKLFRFCAGGRGRHAA